MPETPPPEDRPEEARPFPGLQGAFKVAKSHAPPHPEPLEQGGAHPFEKEEEIRRERREREAELPLKPCRLFGGLRKGPKDG